MSIFESLLDESDDNTRRNRLLSVVQPRIRDKIAPILSDTNTTLQITPDGQAGIARIVYGNAHGKVILSPNGISRVDDFGTTWAVANHTQAQTRHSRGLYPA